MEVRRIFAEHARAAGLKRDVTLKPGDVVTVFAWKAREDLLRFEKLLQTDPTLRAK